MIDPGSIKEEYKYLDKVEDIIKLDSLPEYDRADYDLLDEKSFKSYIYDTEKCIRDSIEYKKMVSYLRDYLDMNKCAFYENVSNIDTTKIRIEIHHSPFQLSDLTYIVYNKRVAFRESLETELVAEEIMWLHYMSWVGLIPLAETVHELVHNQYIFVPCNKVYGKWQEIYNRYKPYMFPEQITAMENIIQASEYVNDSYETILSKKYIYVDASGAYNLPKLEDVAQLLKNRIGELMDNPPEPIEKPKEIINPIIILS